jgi:hypothetical protein
MKNIIYIGLFAMLLLFSCSKEQPLQPINTGETYTPSMIIISETGGNTNTPMTTGNKNTTKSSDDDKNGNSDSSGDITDPEKGDGKGKSNKKAKN